ncbi:hypothetical protein DBT40_06805 [Aerococcus tenax]|nr:hypothetical protein DBT40_06805 [Aerococcus urinae]RAW04755.1 hypothetical protein DBT41_06815 [Aerococcus urinae]
MKIVKRFKKIADYPLTRGIFICISVLLLIWLISDVHLYFLKLILSTAFNGFTVILYKSVNKGRK